jgi:hypothetical protein
MRRPAAFALPFDPKNSHRIYLMRAQANLYRIRLRGRLDPARSAWFGELSVTVEDDFTVLTGEIQDQPALFGVLAKIRDLGLELESLERLNPGG